MDTETGEIRPLADDEQPRENEVAITEAEMAALTDIPSKQRMARLTQLRKAKTKRRAATKRNRR